MGVGFRLLYSLRENGDIAQTKAKGIWVKLYGGLADDWWDYAVGVGMTFMSVDGNGG